MNKKYFTSLFLATALAFVSCKKEEPAVEKAANQKPVPSVYEIVNGTNMPKKPVQMQPGTAVAPTQTTTTTTVTPPAPVTVAKGMNPPHGQPGHRCDIKVGEPLNSPPGKMPVPPSVAATQQKPAQSFTVTPATASGSTTTTSQNSAVPKLLDPSATATAPGMNPPHGQEGHRCDIAVGAPLPKT